MKSWMRERDRLLEQSRAFVQRVAAAHPDVIIPVPVVRATTQTIPVLPKVLPTPVDLGEAGASADDHPQGRLLPPRIVSPTRAADSARLDPPLRTRPVIASERDDIVNRVAAFRAHQDRLTRERAAYYASMQARIRTELNNDVRGHRAPL